MRRAHAAKPTARSSAVHTARHTAYPPCICCKQERKERPLEGAGREAAFGVAGGSPTVAGGIERDTRGSGKVLANYICQAWAQETLCLDVSFGLIFTQGHHVSSLLAAVSSHKTWDSALPPSHADKGCLSWQHKKRISCELRCPRWPCGTRIPAPGPVLWTPHCPRCTEPSCQGPVKCPEGAEATFAVTAGQRKVSCRVRMVPEMSTKLLPAT